MNESRNLVVPPLDNTGSGEVQNESNIESSSPSNVEATKAITSANDLSGKKYISLDDFKVELSLVEKLWKSKDKILTIKPMTKGDRDAVLKPINGQKIEASADGSTKGFFISLDLFDDIKKSVIIRSLSHYVGQNGKSTVTKETLEALDNGSYEELASLCLSVNRIDLFEANASDVVAATEAKN